MQRAALVKLPELEPDHVAPRRELRDLPSAHGHVVAAVVIAVHFKPDAAAYVSGLAVLG